MATNVFARSALHVLAAGAALWIVPAVAGPLSLSYAPQSSAPFETTLPAQAPADEADIDTPLNPALARQIVPYATKAAAGTIIIDTPHTYLYYVLGGGKAIRYGIGVGREGFTWSGTQVVSNKTEWPDWVPPPEMIARQPYLPRWVAGGETNPLGARAIYLGNTMYRIHGTNMPQTIGKRVSSGCIRMLNADVVDLYSRVDVGTRVIVLPQSNTYAGLITPAAPANATRSERRGPHIY